MAPPRTVRSSIPPSTLVPRLAPAVDTPDLPPGAPEPLGATLDAGGVNFAVWSESGRRVDLCLFDAHGRNERRIRLPYRTGQVFHAYVPGLKAGQLYGYRVHGPYEPAAGHRFNPHKLLVDPYARSLHGEVDYSQPIYGHDESVDGTRGDAADVRDDAAGVPLAVVSDDSFDWQGTKKPRVAWSETLIYEAHVRGMTRLHPHVPPELRGTYAGLAHPSIIRHLKAIGATAIELLPIHHCVTEPSIAGRKLTNYWGYSTLGFFAPDPRWAKDPTNVVREVKEMIRAFHAEGIEVLLDVVYNHTCEGDPRGPTLSFRGLDNRAYYRLDPRDAHRYEDVTGCGNTLDVNHPQVLKLVMDSLRYWSEVMQVDGFRFDLATALARDGKNYDRGAAFFDLLHQDPTLRGVKMIAEPWDVGEGGYQVGGFPVGWMEWNGKYRDTVRRFLRGQRETMGELGYRLTGSSDLFAASGRAPQASINFVTAHDGFTLRDLVSYDRKHNEANGENNGDGSDSNDSWNGGVEGETTNVDLVAQRKRRMKTFLATLMLSAGVPMLRMGDEVGHTQHGNNNAYCQDNEMSWIDWKTDPESLDIYAFVQKLAAVRRTHPSFRRAGFFQGTTVLGSKQRDLVWFTPGGDEMHGADWHQPRVAALMMRTDGEALGDVDGEGKRVKDHTFLLLVNAEHDDVSFKLPEPYWGAKWQTVLTTVDGHTPRNFAAGEGLALPSCALLLLRLATSRSATSS